MSWENPILQVNIRGKLGMQIFELHAGLTAAFNNEWTVDGIHVNIGNGDDPGFHNRLLEIFETNIPIKNVPGVRKQSVWSPEGMRRAFANRGKVQSLFKPRTDIVSTRYDRILHIRGQDKNMASADAYVPAALKFDKPFTIMSDDKRLTGAVVLGLQLQKSLNPDISFQISDQDDVRDWKSIYWADEVRGTPSSFTLSTLLFNPDKRMHIIRENNGPFKLSKDNIAAVEAIMEFCPNVEWI